MVRIIFRMLTVMLLTVFLQSCQEDLLSSYEQESLNQSIETKTYVSQTSKIERNFKFLYEGKNYEYTATIVNDSVVDINGEEAETILLELEQDSNMVTFLHMNGTIELFKNRDSFYSNLENIIEKERMSLSQGIEPYKADVPWDYMPPIDKSDNKIANLYLCDDNFYSDTYHQFDLRSGEKVLEINELKSVGLNDKVTSFAAYTIGGTTLFELYEDSDFKDSCISFVVYENQATQWSGDVIFKWGPPAAQYGQLLVADLKDLLVKGHKVDTWNDRISSVRITRK